MIASGPLRPACSPASTAASGVTCSRVDEARGDRAGELAAVRGLLPLVAVQLARGDRREARLGLARAVGAEHVEVLARAQVGGVDDDLGARRDRADDVARERLGERADAPAELRRERLGGGRARVEADPRARSRRRPCSARPTSR